MVGTVEKQAGQNGIRHTGMRQLGYFIMLSSVAPVKLTGLCNNHIVRVEAKYLIGCLILRRWMVNLRDQPIEHVSKQRLRPTAFRSGRRNRRHEAVPNGNG